MAGKVPEPVTHVDFHHCKSCTPLQDEIEQSLSLLKKQLQIVEYLETTHRFDGSVKRCFHLRCSINNPDRCSHAPWTPELRAVHLQTPQKEIVRLSAKIAGLRAQITRCPELTKTLTAASATVRDPPAAFTEADLARLRKEEENRQKVARKKQEQDEMNKFTALLEEALEAALEEERQQEFKRWQWRSNVRFQFTMHWRRFRDAVIRIAFVVTGIAPEPDEEMTDMSGTVDPATGEPVQDEFTTDWIEISA